MRGGLGADSSRRSSDLGMESDMIVSLTEADSSFESVPSVVSVVSVGFVRGMSSCESFVGAPGGATVD